MDQEVYTWTSNEYARWVAERMSELNELLFGTEDDD
jgi:hypothetical protein